MQNSSPSHSITLDMLETLPRTLRGLIKVEVEDLMTLTGSKVEVVRYSDSMPMYGSENTLLFYPLIFLLFSLHHFT